MLQAYANKFVAAGAIAFDIRARFSGALHPPDSFVSGGDLEWLKAQLQDLGNDCIALELYITVRLISNFWMEFESAMPTCRRAEEMLTGILNTFGAELSTHVFMHVLPHRVRYWSTEAQLNCPTGIIGTDVNHLLESLAVFPNAKYDAREAGNCITYGLFTAAVYHLMRCAEFGLVSVAKSASVPDEKITKGWDGCIQGIQSHINTVSSTKPTGDWQDQIKKYGDLASWFTTIQKGWRNPSCHTPRMYSEGSAAGMFSAICTLFDHLRKYGFAEAAMPPDLLIP